MLQARRLAAERAVDQVLADSFPASDPPSWNPGIVRPDPLVSRFEPDVARSVAMERSFLQRVVSFAAAIGTVSLLPLAILLIGSPVAVAVRGLLELIGWVIRADLSAALPR